MRFPVARVAMCLPLLLAAFSPQPSFATGDITKVNHVIIIMQENHSYDNYFGALAYAPNSPYHNGNGKCDMNDHTCVDGLTCSSDANGNLTCSNSNLDQDGSTVFAFHNSSRCVLPDLDHSWLYTHFELNFLNPNRSKQGRMDGFVRVNDPPNSLTPAERIPATTAPCRSTTRRTSRSITTSRRNSL